MQTVSCYGLLSQDTILNPQPTGQQITLPFYPGYRYAAVPGSIINNLVQVDSHPSRPPSLVYHDHCHHLMDIKVSFFLILPKIIYRVSCLQIPKDNQFDSPLTKSTSDDKMKVISIYLDPYLR